MISVIYASPLQRKTGETVSYQKQLKSLHLGTGSIPGSWFWVSINSNTKTENMVAWTYACKNMQARQKHLKHTPMSVSWLHCINPICMEIKNVLKRKQVTEGEEGWPDEGEWMHHLKIATQKKKKKKMKFDAPGDG